MTAVRALARVLKLIYLGTVHARMHLTSYVASLVGSALWFVFVFAPVLVLSGDAVSAYTTFLPGLLALLSCGVAVSTAVEFLRWFVNQGLTDMFRENGLNVFSYLLSSVHVDVLAFSPLSYLLIGYTSSYYVGLDPLVIMPPRPYYFLAALMMLVPTYLLVGSLVAYLYTVTRISSAWTLLLQLALMLGTVVPPTLPPDPLVYLANPATIASELARAAYYSNVIDDGLLAVLSIVVAPAYLVVAHLLGRKSDKRISRHGLEYRY